MEYGVTFSTIVVGRQHAFSSMMPQRLVADEICVALSSYEFHWLDLARLRGKCEIATI